MEKISYIGYKPNTIGFGEATAVTGGAIAPITLIIDGAVAILPFIMPFISNFFAHPAADARNIISEVKKQLPSLNARDRMARVIAVTQSIDKRAKDVEARELILWYRQNYSNDYKDLYTDDKVYFNNWALNQANTYFNVNQASNDYKKSLFTDNEVNTGLKIDVPSTLTNIVTNKSNLLLYVGAGLLLLLILKNKN
jgi:hypothetical protein